MTKPEAPFWNARRLTLVSEIGTPAGDVARESGTLEELTERRELLAKQLLIIRSNLAEQNRMADGAELINDASFRRACSEANPGAAREMKANYAACLLATRIVPDLQARLAVLEDDLQKTEARIAALSHR